MKVSKAGLCEFPIDITSIYPLAKREVLKGFSRVTEWHYSTINIILRLKLYKCHGITNYYLFTVHCFKIDHRLCILFKFFISIFVNFYSFLISSASTLREQKEISGYLSLA